DRASFAFRVSYDSYPDTPTAMSTTLPSRCVSTTSGTDTASLPRLNPDHAGAGLRLGVKVHDVDGGTVGAEFEWWPKATRGTSGMIGSSTTPTSSPNDSTIAVTVTAGTFADGQAYSWRAYGYDGQLFSKSAAAWCEFVVDATLPAAPTVTS